MTAIKKITGTKPYFLMAEVLTSLGLFLLALLPRAYDLPRFVTADEAKWVYRSAQFLAAFLRGDYAATSVNLTPAVTTTWLGSLGLIFYHWLNRATFNLPLTDWLTTLPEFRTELEILVATRWPMVIFTSLAAVVIYRLTRRLVNPTAAFVAAALIALDPHTVSLSRILGHDAPAAMLMTISLLALLVAVKYEDEREAESGKRRAGSGEREAESGKRKTKQEEDLSSAPLHLRAPAWPLILSGMTAGLAFLSKAPALFLIPFAGLVFVSRIWVKRSSLSLWLKKFVLWSLVAYLTFIVVWPAAWVEPAGRPLAVFGNAFLSATDQEEADAAGYWLVPDLGPFYYVVNGAFKLSPLVMVGAALALVFGSRPGDDVANDETRGAGSGKREARSGKRGAQSEEQGVGGRVFSFSIGMKAQRLISSSIFWLAVFIVLFTLFLTLSDKRSPRYLLPAFPPLALIAAFGWLKLYQVAGNRVAGDKSQVESKQPQTEENLSEDLTTVEAVQFATPAVHSLPVRLSGGQGTSVPNPQSATRNPQSAIPNPQSLFAFVLIFSALVILLPYGPYYFTYFNPLLGGSYTAPRLVKIGWGEGLDRVGRFLQRELTDSRVGTAYASTVAPYFKGDLSGVTGSHLDYVVLYCKQVQSGGPSPAFIRYFEQTGSIFSVRLNGIRYADVYAGPAVQPAAGGDFNDDPSGPAHPIGFRPLTPYGHLGERLTVDVLWPAQTPVPTAPVTVTLEPLVALNSHRPAEDDAPDDSTIKLEQKTVLSEGQGRRTRLADDLVVSRHQIILPDDLARGTYALFVDGQPLGEVEFRNFQIPEHLKPVNDLIFDEQIALAAFQLTLDEDFLDVDIAWQAQKPHLPDYTVFVQILEAETNQRVAGVDTQPQKGEWPTSRWVKHEVVVDEYLVAVPPDFRTGFYKVIVGLYRPETGERLTLADGRDHWTLPWTLIRE